jgi:hypothetical protein
MHRRMAALEARRGRVFNIDSAEEPLKMGKSPSFSRPRMRANMPQIGLFQRNPIFAVRRGGRIKPVDSWVRVAA